MDVLLSLRDRAASGALVANLLVAVVLTAAALAFFWSLRRLLRAWSGRLVKWISSHHLKAVSKEAVRRAEVLLFRLTLMAVLLIVAGAAAYHFAGRDVQADIGAWFAKLDATDLLGAGARILGVVFILPLTWAIVQAVRRVRPLIETPAVHRLARPEDDAAVRRWFGVLERLIVGGIALTVAGAAVYLLGLPPAVEWVIGFVARLTCILAGVLLLPPIIRLLDHKLADFGDRRLGGGRLHRYWERVRRLFPFGQRCFEAAVYVYAASLGVRELAFIAFIADYGPRLVGCIGLFFGCRVAIELSQVLLHEAFGLYDERKPIDPKGRTLVPLLHSVCRYILYFGSAVVMLGVLGVDTRPILAGAGLLGLAVGLGAQSLVTDFVSGFFILFEGQFLVGDIVQIGDACGRVEVVGIRHTQIRDGQGKLHIIPNGQIKAVVNSSKDYINAVVDMKVPANSDLQEVLGAMREAGERLRRENLEEVLAETDVQGLVDLGPTDMTVRAATQVQPGSQTSMQNEYRRLLKQVLDERREAAAPRVAA
jgi:moderate conductance mechanosensitive channel